MARRRKKYPGRGHRGKEALSLCLHDYQWDPPLGETWRWIVSG